MGGRIASDIRVNLKKNIPGCLGGTFSSCSFQGAPDVGDVPPDVFVAVTLRGGSVAVDFLKSRLTGKKAGVERNPDFLNMKKQGDFFSPVEMN